MERTWEKEGSGCSTLITPHLAIIISPLLTRSPAVHPSNTNRDLTALPSHSFACLTVKAVGKTVVLCV